MNDLMKLYKNQRTNSYFKSYAIMQIHVAHRIKEYLDADKQFPSPNTKQATMDLFLQKDFHKAIDNIFNEVGFYPDSSSDYQRMQDEAISFAEDLLKEYLVKNKQLLSEREQLLIRLGEIDDQLRSKERK